VDIERLSSESVEMSIKSGNSLEKVSPEISKTASLIKAIASSGIEQLSGIDQINSAMGQLNNISQNSVSTSEQVAASAEQLMEQAGQLIEMVDYFTINKEKSKEDNSIIKKEIKKIQIKTQGYPHINKSIKSSIKPVQNKGFKLNIGSDSEPSDDEFEKF